jgi:hypothetical protein
MHGTPARKVRTLRLFGVGALLAGVLTAVGAPQAVSAPAKAEPKFTEAVAYDVSKPLRVLATTEKASARDRTARLSPERGTTVKDAGFSGDPAVQATSPAATAAIGGTIANFEGLGQQDNFNLLARRVNPPDPVGDVGPNHYVEMVNLTFAVYSKTGTRLLGPLDLGSLWAGFPIEDCTDESGDPIVLYDQTTDRWLLTQFTTRGLNPATPTVPFYNCVAVSQTGDPTGAYYRYAFITQPDLEDGGYFFPDYPKYGVWRDTYIMTTRDFGFDDRYGISVYGLEKNKMVDGDPNARAVQFFLEDRNVPLNLIGDGLLPPDLDGTTKPKNDVPAPIVGTQDDGAGYGATFDALNIWEFDVKWRSTPVASIVLKTQLPVAAFDSIFPCGVVPSTTPGEQPTARDCLPQPGVTDGSRFLDILSYRQRPIHRLAYRNKGAFETMVTNQSVEALPALGGTRWYEIRRTGGTYSVHQQGTYALPDGVHNWMGSIAADKNGNMALGYSVVSATDVFPGIRYTGRLSGDPLGLMTLGEGVVINGTAAQTHVNSRWGDYTSMNVDPVDDCTFWYVNEYYTVEGAAMAPLGNGWQTRIASFRLPGC